MINVSDSVMLEGLRLELVSGLELSKGYCCSTDSSSTSV